MREQMQAIYDLAVEPMPKAGVITADVARTHTERHDETTSLRTVSSMTESLMVPGGCSTRWGD